jgi:hypothetical protein
MANAHKVGLLFGTLLGGFHLLWALMVFLGLAQMIMDFVFWAHMLRIPMTVGPFDVTAAAVLVVMTYVIGYVLGYAGARVWKRVH